MISHPGRIQPARLEHVHEIKNLFAENNLVGSFFGKSGTRQPKVIGVIASSWGN